MNEYMPLQDITVLDLTRVVAGPFCGAMLADMGARVIKIEIPGKGDDARAYGPHINEESLYYANLNRNKHGITLNLKTEEGKEILKELVKKADILIENYRPGVMERLGLGYEDLKLVNPRLIYGAISGFGSYGEYKNRPGYDIIAQAMGGLMSITGQKGSPPTRVGSAMGDILGGLNLSIGLLTALHGRSVTGKGQKVDIALVDCVVASLEQAVQRYVTSGVVPVRNGNAYESIAPYDTYKAKDGYVVIGCGNQKMYEKFCNEIIGMPELITDERFLTVPLRVKNNEEMKAYFEKWTGDKTVEEVVDIVLGAGIPSSPIFDLKDIVNNSHIAGEREMIINTSHPVMGDVILNGNPVKLSDYHMTIRKQAPTLGEDTEAVLRGLLGKSQEEILGLRERQVL